jgi:hypothetical protein
MPHMRLKFSQSKKIRMPSLNEVGPHPVINNYCRFLHSSNIKRFPPLF